MKWSNFLCSVAVFYLYIVISGPDSSTVEAGQYESKDACKAVGAKIAREINDKPQIKAAGNVEASFRCTQTPMTNA